MNMLEKQRNYFDSVVISLTSICNLHCSYCQNNNFMEEMKNDIMPIHTLTKLLREAFEDAQMSSSNRIEFCFTGGEPLLAGIDYFNKIVEIQKLYNRTSVKVTNIIQTNGTLLDETWVKFIKKNNFGVSISIDGPPQVHNSQRPMKVGDDSFSRITKNLECLKFHGIPFGILAVITETSASYPEEVVRCLLSLEPGIIAFLPCVDRGDVVSPDSFSFFMKKAFDIWIDPNVNKNSIPIRTFRDICLHLFGILRSKECDYFGECPLHPNIAVDGSISVCDQFVGKDGGHLGNITLNTISEVLGSKQASEVLCASQNLPANCRKCDYLELCNGGCLYRRSKNHNYEPLCEMRKEMFFHIINKISELTGDAKPM